MVALNKLPVSYVAMDLETTGLDPASCGIVEIAGVKVIDGVVAETFQTLVDTDARMSAEATKINGISREMLKGAPKTSEAITSFIGFAGDLPLLGHNAVSFDKAFIEKACAYAPNASAPNEWYDTMVIYKQLHGHRISLVNLCEEAGVVNDKAHRALSDAQATHECYQWLRAQIAATTTDANDFTDIADDGPLHGEVVCITGNHGSMSRHDLMALICEKGGKPSNNVTLKTTMLVDFGGGTETGKLKKASEYRERTGIRIIDGRKFCEIADVPYTPPPKAPANVERPVYTGPVDPNQSGKKNGVNGGCVAIVIVLVVFILLFVFCCGH